MSIRPARRRLRLAALALAVALPVTAAPALAATPLSASEESESPSEEPSEPSESPSEDAEPPEVPGLEPIEGGPTGDEAAPVVAGRYVDVMPEQPRNAEGADVQFNIYDFERTIPGSTIRFGVTMQGEGVTASTRIRALFVRLTGDGESERCGAPVRVPQLYPTAMPVASFGGTSFPFNKACRDADFLRLGILAFGSSAPPPGTPYELTIWEVPRPTNPDDLFPPLARIGPDTAEPVAAEDVTAALEPGPTKQEATPVPGDLEAAHVELPVGQVSWFAVPLEASTLLAADVAVTDVDRINQGAALEVEILAPEGGFAASTVETYDDPTGVFDPAYGQSGVVGTGLSRVQAQTDLVGPAAYNNLSRSTYKSDFLDPTYPLIAEAGTYYLAVYTQDLTGTDGEATLPATITFLKQDQGTDDFYEDPEYDTDYPEPLPGPVSDVEPTEYDGAAEAQELQQQEAEEEQASEEPVEDGTVPWWAYVLGVVLVLALAAGAFLLARRGRSSGRSPGGPGPQGPYQQGPYQQGGPWQQGPGPSSGQGGPPPGPYQQGPPPGWGPPPGPHQGPQGPQQGPQQGPPQQGPPTPPTQIRPGPHPGQSGEWIGRPGQGQRPPEQPGSWSPPEDDERR